MKAERRPHIALHTVGAMLVVLACADSKQEFAGSLAAGAAFGESEANSGGTGGAAPGQTPGAGVSGATNSGGEGEAVPGGLGGVLARSDAGAVAPGASDAGASVGEFARRGFYVDGRTLRDRCGEKVVLRGVNEMVIYSPSQDGNPFFSEMEKSGANSVRITWNTSGAVSKLDAALSNAIANQMIPMVTLNDATGDLTKLPLEVDYWVRSDVVAAIAKYEDKALVNIANEAGNGTVTQAEFTSAYQSAITRMREAGIHTPLVIDGSSWGQDIDMLQAVGPGLLDFDPEHNLIFSVHMYWNDASGARVTREISESVNMNLPLIVGEFAQHAVAGCSASPFAYTVLMSVANSSEIGVMPWSWGGVVNGDCGDDEPFDMTTNGTYEGLQGWGREVVVSDPNSIQNTAVRSQYVVTGRCD
jgi:mannan endo-1,4-beta-mannosidase